MDGLILLRRAQAAGLTVQAVGTRLKISGPRQAEPIVKLLAEHKSKVLAAIASAADRRWHERYTALTFVWSNGGRRKWAEARHLRGPTCRTNGMRCTEPARQHGSVPGVKIPSVAMPASTCPMGAGCISTISSA